MQEPVEYQVPAATKASLRKEVIKITLIDAFKIAPPEERAAQQLHVQGIASEELFQDFPGIDPEQLTLTRIALHNLERQDIEKNMGRDIKYPNTVTIAVKKNRTESPYSIKVKNSVVQDIYAQKNNYCTFSFARALQQYITKNKLNVAVWQIHDSFDVIGEPADVAKVNKWLLKQRKNKKPYENQTPAL
jgi:hypothetical protein